MTTPEKNNTASIREIFADRLKTLREDANLTQSELAEQIESSRASVSYYENMKRTPDITFLADASRFFNVDPNYMIGYESNVQPIKEVTSLQKCWYHYSTSGTKIRSEMKLVCTHCHCVWDKQAYVFHFCPGCGRFIIEVEEELKDS